MSFLNSIFSSITSFIGAYSFDVSIIFFIFIFLFWYGLWYEKHRLTSLILSFYVALGLFKIFPYFEDIYILGDSEKMHITAEILLFLVFVILSVLVFNRVIKGKFPKSGISRWFNIGILSLSTTGFLCAFSANMFLSEEFYTFAEPIAFLFSSAKVLFYWMIVPLIVLFITSRPAV